MSRVVLVGLGLLAISGRVHALEASDCDRLGRDLDGPLAIEVVELVQATDRLPSHCRYVVLVPESVRFELRTRPSSPSTSMVSKLVTSLST